MSKQIIIKLPEIEAIHLKEFINMYGHEFLADPKKYNTGRILDKVCRQICEA